MDESPDETEKAAVPEPDVAHLLTNAKELRCPENDRRAGDDGPVSSSQSDNSSIDTESEVNDVSDSLGSVENGSHDSSCVCTEAVPGFVTSRSLLPETFLGHDVFLSPGFRSAAARAGWDDESLLLATEDGNPCLNLAVHEDEQTKPDARSPAIFAKSPQIGVFREMRDKKREERTPQLAATPLSAGRRHRRARRQAIHECSPEALPIGDLSLKEEFQEAVSQQAPQEHEHSTAQRIQESRQQEETVSLTLDEATNQKPACLDQLREELSCAICLDICFEPSTTSCGHSFCKPCMQSVLQKCGLRCPKCRQQLKGDSWRSCPVNVVLWNTVQLLFPAEVAVRKEVAALVGKTEAACDSEVARRGPEPARSAAPWQHARPPSSGLRRRGSGRRTANTSGREERRLPFEEVPRSQQDERSVDTIRERQVLADAAFARRLQMQLTGRSRNADGVRRSNSSPTNLASAAANLRAMANRAVRNRSRR